MAAGPFHALSSPTIEATAVRMVCSSQISRSCVAWKARAASTTDPTLTRPAAYFRPSSLNTAAPPLTEAMSLRQPRVSVAQVR